MSAEPRTRSVLAGLTCRPVGVFVAAMAMSIFLVSLATAYSIYELRATGDAIRQPIVSSSPSSESTKVQLAHDQLADRRQFSVILYQPNSDESPVPPGVPRDLAPGEVVVSPELARTGASERIESRYGRVVGLISRHGLSAADERIAYVRARRGQIPTDAMSVEGFSGYSSSPWGVGTSFAIGESLMIQPLIQVLAAIIIVLGLPAVSLLMMLAFVARRRRAASDLVMRALGAPVRFRRNLAIQGALTSAFAGAFLVGVAWLVINAVGVRVPYIDFELSTDLIRVPGVVALAAAVVCTVSVFAIPPSAKARAVRPTVRVETLPSWALAVGPLLLLVGTVATRAAEGNALVERWCSWLTIAVCVVVMPASAAAAAAMVGKLVQAAAASRGAATPMLAGAWLASSARQLWVVGMGLTVAVTVGIQVAGMGLVVSEPMQSALRVQSKVGQSVAVVQGSDGGDIARFESELAPRTVVVSGRRQADGTVTYSATCVTWTALDEECANRPVDTSSPKVAEALNAAGGGMSGRMTIEPPTLASENGFLVVFDTSGGALDLPTLKQDAYQTLPGFPSVQRVADGWVDFGRAYSTRWVILWAAVGLLFALGAIAVGVSITARRNSRQLAPVLALWGRARRGFTTTSFAVGLPLLAIGLVASYTSWVLVLPTRRRMADPAPLDALTGYALLGVVAFAALVSAYATHQARVSAAAWRRGP